MEELVAAGGAACATDQVLYNLTRRGPELDLLPWLAAAKRAGDGVQPRRTGPAAQQPPRLAKSPRRLEATPAQVALAWVMRQDGVMAIPKAGSVAPRAAKIGRRPTCTCPPANWPPSMPPFPDPASVFHWRCCRSRRESFLSRFRNGLIPAAGLLSGSHEN